MIRRLPLRLRVALAFALTTAMALLALGSFTYLRVESTLEAQTRTALAAQLDALRGTPPGRRRDAVEEMTGESFAQVLTTDGDLVASSSMFMGVLMTPDEVPSRTTVSLERAVFLPGEREEGSAVLLAERVYDQILVVGTSTEDVEETLDGVLTQLLIGGPLALLLASALGYAVAGVGLRPLDRMRARADTISIRSSGDRLPLPEARDEVHRLGLTLNGMLDRLDAGLRRERRFVAEASHELRTPLALLRTELDLARSRPRSAEELTAAVASASEEVDRLGVLVDDLLLLAISDESHLELDRSRVDVRLLVEEVARRFASSADGRSLTVAEGSPIDVVADRRRLDQAVSNLVDNAVRHGAGAVVLSATSEGSMTVISVADEGTSPLGEEVFERFRRGSDSRVGGRGLGLAIVRAIVTEHGGAVAVSSGQDGTVFRIELPAGAMR